MTTLSSRPLLMALALWFVVAFVLGATGFVESLQPPLPQLMIGASALTLILFGIADILLVVVTATRIALADPSQMLPIVTFPMSLVPTFVVPIIIASHVLVVWRLSLNRA